jgi:hypothetical protein
VVAAISAGLDVVGTDLVAITDDDAVAAPDWLARLERHYAADERLGAVGGRDRVHVSDGVLDGAAREVGRLWWYGRLIANHHIGVGRPRPVHVLKGANMSFRMAALDGIRPDGRLLGHGAQVHFELGLCLPLTRGGWTVLYDPALVVDHYPAPRFDEDARGGPSLRAQANTAHNELYLLLRWLPAWRKPIALAYAFLVGSRRAPGLLLLPERLAREGDYAAVARRFRAAQRGRAEAVATAVSARLAERWGTPAGTEPISRAPED